MVWLESVGVASRTILCHPVIQLKSSLLYCLRKTSSHKKPSF